MMRSQSTNGLAIAALVLSLACLSPVAVVLGHVSLGQIKRSREGGRELAIIGLVFGYLGLLLWIVWIGLFILGLSQTSEY